MKKFLCLLLGVALTLSLSATALAAGELTVSDKTMTVCEASKGYTAYVYAVLENTGDQPIKYSDGTLELLNKDGKSIDSQDYLTCYPTVIDPGKKAYLTQYINVQDAKSADYIADYKLSVNGTSADENKIVALDCTAELGMAPYSYSSDTEYLSVTATIKNTGADTVHDIYLVYALLDADGKVMYVDYSMPSYVGIPAGQTLEIRKTINSDLTDKWDADGVKPASVEAVAYSRQGD